MAERPGDVHEDCGGRGVHLLKILIFLCRRYESLHARSGRDHSQPDHAFVSPLLLELLHVPALIMLAGVRAPLIVPFQDHVLAFVIGELLRLSVIINGVKPGAGSPTFTASAVVIRKTIAEKRIAIRESSLRIIPPTFKQSF